MPRKERVDNKAAFVAGMIASSSKVIKKRLGQIRQTGAWLTQMPLKLNGTILSKDDLFDNTWLHYGMSPVNLCKRCDGCGARFSVEHELSCKKGGLVCQCHDDIRDEAGQLAAMALTPSHVS